MQVRSAGKRALSRILRLRDLVRREYQVIAATEMPLRERLALYRHGFTSEAGVMYDLSGDRHHLYLSDLAHALHAPLINGASNPTLNDKVIFFHTMRSLGAATPTIHGLVGRHGIGWFESFPDHGGGGLLALLERDRELVLKPAAGGRGRGVVFLALHDGRLTVNGEPRERHALADLLTPGTLISQRLRQGAWSDAIYPGATNTLRLMTMWDLDRSEPFVASASHRFGTEQSAPVDNVSKGGVVAGVDVETGVLGGAVTMPRAGRLDRHTHHPGTGAPIAGVAIPGWRRMVEGVLAVSRRLPHIPYIGWDVLVTDDAWWIIEGNHYPDPACQMFGPLLADPRIRRFYEAYGVISPRRRSTGYW
jgi:hypothetical protein